MSCLEPLPNTAPQQQESHRQKRNRVYRFIGEQARAGDIIFVITGEGPPSGWLARLKWWLNYRIQGHPGEVQYEWGTMVFSHMRKESRGANKLPIAFQSKEPILKKIKIPPGYFRDGTRIEILRHKDADEERGQLVCDYLEANLDQDHDHSELRWNRLTFMLGLPNFFIKRGKVNCVRTTMEAYAQAGLRFSHRCYLMPFWNYARWRGRPMFHCKQGVNPTFNYLQDHHLYSDPGMQTVAAVFQENGRYIMQTDVEKFSWIDQPPPDGHLSPQAF